MRVVKGERVRSGTLRQVCMSKRVQGLKSKFIRDEMYNY